MITSAIAAVFNAVSGWFGFQSKVQDRDNASDMIANKNAKTDAAEADKITGDVQKGDKTGDLTQERKDFSE